MRRWFILAAAATLAAALGAAIPATAATHSTGHPAQPITLGLTSTVRVLTTPTVDYLVTGKESGHDYYHEITTSTIANPSNYAVRAVLECTGGSNAYGAWENGLGGSSASCAPAYGFYGFVEYDRTHQYTLPCFAPGDPPEGQC